MSEKRPVKAAAGIRLVPQHQGERGSLASEVRNAFNQTQKQPAKSTESGSHAAPNEPRRRGLGRGLSALMSSTVARAVPEATDEIPFAVGNVVPAAAPTLAAVLPTTDTFEPQEKGPILHYLPINKLIGNPDQPRQYFNEEDLLSLASSIKESGLLQPILVRKDPRGSEQFEIVAGERRWRAATRAGLSVVPVMLHDISNQEALEIGIIENVQRANLNPIEEAEGYQRLVSEFGLSQGDIAETVGKDRASIANVLRLLKLSRPVRDLLVEGKLSAGHGRALLMAPSEARQIELAQLVIKEGLSVRRTEQLAVEETSETAGTFKATREKAPVSPAMQGLEDRLRRGLGTKVQIVTRGKDKGELRLSFFSAEELESLIERLGV